MLPSPPSPCAAGRGLVRSSYAGRSGPASGTGHVGGGSHGIGRRIIGRIVWLKFEVGRDGTVRTVETREAEGGLTRRAREFGALEEAEAEYGPGFREVVEKALAAESRRGRWRP